MYDVDEIKQVAERGKPKWFEEWSIREKTKSAKRSKAELETKTSSQ